MDYSRQINTSMWILIFLQAIGSIDVPGSAKPGWKKTRKLPAPKQFVAIFAAWSALQVMDDADMGKAAAMMGWIFLLTALAVGPFGLTLVHAMNYVPKYFATPPPASTAVVSPPSSGSPIQHA